MCLQFNSHDLWWCYYIIRYTSQSWFRMQTHTREHLFTTWRGGAFTLGIKIKMLIIFYIYVFQLCHAKWCKTLTECSSSSEDHVSSRRWRKGCDRLSVRKISRTCRKMVKVLLLKAKHIVDMVNFSGRSLQYHFATVTIGCFSPWLSAMIE